MNNTALEMLLGREEGAGGEEMAGQCTDVYVFAARSSDKQEDLKLLQLGRSVCLSSRGRST